MLGKALSLASAGNAAGGLIEYVGGYVQGFPGSTSARTITLTSLTGGLDSQPAEGDMVIVYFAIGYSGSRITDVIGYTQVAQLAQAGNTGANRSQLSVEYKFMGATPDTSFQVAGVDSTSHAGTVCVAVFRGVDSDNPFDVTTQTAQFSNTVRPTPPAITPVTPNSYIVVGGAGGHPFGVQTYTSSDLTGFITVGADDTYDVTNGLGYHAWTSGTFAPARFGHSRSDQPANSSCAVTMALRPK